MVNSASRRQRSFARTVCIQLFNPRSPLQRTLERNLGYLPKGAVAGFMMSLMAVTLAAEGHKLSRPPRSPEVVEAVAPGSRPR